MLGGRVMLKKASQTQKLSQDFFQDCNILTGIRYKKCNAFCLQLIQSNAKTHVRIAPSKGIKDWIPDSLSVELGFRIQSTRFQLDSNRQDSLIYMADSKAKNSFCFPQEKNPTLRNPDSLTLGDRKNYSWSKQPVQGF